MTPAPHLPWLAALLGRLGESLADPAQIAALQERLQRHGAELQGQLTELLLRSPDPQASVEVWLSCRDLSHWHPQAWGGSASDGWQFEQASLNRARGAEPMDAADIAAAHGDGGFDALLTAGVPEGIAMEMGEAALIAAALQLAWLLTQRHRGAGSGPADPGPSAKAVLQNLAATALNGGAWSVVVSMALALVPGGQLWLSLLTTQGLLQG